MHQSRPKSKQTKIDQCSVESRDIPVCVLCCISLHGKSPAVCVCKQRLTSVLS